MNKQQLANRIWASANNMRNKIDANEYKDYILGLIFYKFLSDTEVKYFTETCGWEEDELPELVENYEDTHMENAIKECQNTIGFFIEYKYLFSTWLNDTTFSVQTLSEALSNFKRLMSDNYASVYAGIFKTLSEGLCKLGNDPSAQTKALKGLIKLIKDIPTDGSQDYDVLGYVYEYLISNFAANAGKKAGEFYTPHEVAMIMSEIVAEHHKDKESLEIYDPTSGSGSLLITRCADTLEEDWPMHEEGSEIDKPLAVDAVVSNPPYSQHWDPKDKELDARFANYGVAPKTKADYAFLLHELHHLKPDGILTIVMPHGVLFRGKTPKIYDKDGNVLPAELREEGQAEGKIRANLIEKNNIDAIGIMGDVEIIQTEGLGACNVVEANTKMSKDKNGVDVEVEDGLKGRIIPFALVQKTLFQSDLDAIAALQSRVEALPDAVIQNLADAITTLSEKYAVTYNDIEQDIAESEQNLAELIGQLTGDEFAISGLQNLIKK